MSELHTPRLAVLASGSGTTANALARGILEGVCDAEIDLVIASKASAGILELVKDWNKDWHFDTDSVVIGNKTHPNGPRKRGQSQESSNAICRALEKADIDLVLQLGYLIIGNDPYIEEWGFVPGLDNSVFDSRALNWHPGLLPLTTDTWGEGASTVMLDAYRRNEITEAGHTVLAVAYEVDGGPKYATHPVPIRPTDTSSELFQRVQWIEKTATPYVVDQFLTRKVEYHTGQSAS